MKSGINSVSSPMKQQLIIAIMSSYVSSDQSITSLFWLFVGELVGVGKIIFSSFIGYLILRQTDSSVLLNSGEIGNL